MSAVWESLGFKASPYDSSPLRCQSEDVDLLAGREEEGVKFCTLIDSASSGVLTLAGKPGVGKTSFFNIYQYLLESSTAPLGPVLLAARKLCPVQQGEAPRDISQRLLHATLANVEEHCRVTGKTVPQQIKRLQKWVNQTPETNWDWGIQILGVGGNLGRTVELPKLVDASFENIQDALACVVSEVVSNLNCDGLFIALDNIENLEDDELSKLLMSFRDTLFTIPNVWWVLIGQTGLYSLLQSLDTRVSDRIVGTGIDLEPISSDELNRAVSKRVVRFHSSGQGKAPLTEAIHQRLFDASFGEIRFVFKYGNSICLAFVTEVRMKFGKLLEKIDSKLIDKALGNVLVDNQIPDDAAERLLTSIVEGEFSGFGLRHSEKQVLQKIKESGSARSKQYKEFGIKSAQDFSSNYLTKMQRQSLLLREQQGSASIYKLRGVAALVGDFQIDRKAGN